MKPNLQPPGTTPTIGFLSTYPPTSCGLATFTQSLRNAITAGRTSDDGLGVVSVVDTPGERAVEGILPEVIHQHVNGYRDSLKVAIKVLNAFDVVSVQHEYGIFGGPDGIEVLEIMDGLDVPAIATLHTVLSQPTPSQRSILEKVVAKAAHSVVMSETAYKRLVGEYSVEPDKIRVIPHGAHLSLGHRPQLGAEGSRPTMLTWGLIGPGKGFEMAIDACAELQDLDPLPRYRILGKTHPKVEASSGTAYLDGLKQRVHDLGLEHMVEFDDRYLDRDELADYLIQSDVVVLPYESTEQVTSGVLVEALAAGRPVVASAFPHAVELLANGAGSVVPHGDSTAMGSALRQIFTHPSLADHMAEKAEGIGSTLQWPSIGRRYDRLAAKLTADHVPAHMLTDIKRGTGVVANTA